MANYSVLFVEDNPHKRARILEFLNSIHLDIGVTEAYSFSSANKLLAVNSYSVVLVDISLPTFDKQGTESGGKFRQFGGREIAKKLVRSGGSAKIIFITQYAAFSDRGTALSFEELQAVLQSECGPNFGGMIFYDSSRYAWKDSLKSAMSAVLS